MTEHLNKVINKFEETARYQESKGILKYGNPLDSLDNYDWLEMAEQEQVDGYKYLVAEMEKRKFIATKIRKLLNYKENSVSNTEINYWLDRLEGK
ncbi:hypothetical protein [Virgibacillus sp. CBA3643]|uniref:hypothetical protein n=1 Tax=Virgibacillus sp. CBA3643 TaxID=2942278 RepID=UPI0035A373C0